MAGSRKAFIVATYRYDDERLRMLQAPQRDADALAEVLADPEIGGFEVQTVVNQTAHDISVGLAEFFAGRRPDDVLLVHFSCHGVKDDSGELFLAATDTRMDLLDATAVPSAYVNKVMTRSRSGCVVLLLDCCYAGAFARGMTRAAGGVDVTDRFGGHGRAVITASTALQYAFEGDGGAAATQQLGGPSVFTRALVDGLRSGDADRDADGNVSLDELYAYVHDEVTRANPDQTPQKWLFDVAGDLIVAKRSAPVTVPSALPRELEGSMHSLLTWERQSVVAPLQTLLTGTHPGLALAARLALQELTEDDSLRVREAARAALATAPVESAGTPPGGTPVAPGDTGAGPGAVPAQAEPVGPVPVESVPVEPVPVESVPVEPVPVEPVPVEPVPVEPVPVEPAPVESAPLVTALETPAAETAEVGGTDVALAPPAVAEDDVRLAETTAETTAETPTESPTETPTESPAETPAETPPGDRGMGRGLWTGWRRWALPGVAAGAVVVLVVVLLVARGGSAGAVLPASTLVLVTDGQVLTSYDADSHAQSTLHADARAPGISGDRQWLSYVEWLPGTSNTALSIPHIVRADGSSQDQALPGIGPNQDCQGGARPTWSPDGQTIAMICQQSTGPSGGTGIVLARESDGWRPQFVLHQDGVCCGITWVDDATLVVGLLKGSGSGSDLVAVDTGTGGVTRIVNGDPFAHDPDWSDQGGLAFVQSDGSPTAAGQVVVAQASGSAAVWTGNGVAADYPVWEPGGSRLAYLQQQGSEQHPTQLVIASAARNGAAASGAPPVIGAPTW